jgi:hypothetical protein
MTPFGIEPATSWLVALASTNCVTMYSGSIGSGALSWGKSGRRIRLTAHLHLMVTLRIIGAIFLLLLQAFKECRGTKSGLKQQEMSSNGQLWREGYLYTLLVGKRLFTHYGWKLTLIYLEIIPFKIYKHS